MPDGGDMTGEILKNTWRDVVIKPIIEGGGVRGGKDGGVDLDGVAEQLQQNGKVTLSLNSQESSELVQAALKKITEGIVLKGGGVEIQGTKVEISGQTARVTADVLGSLDGRSLKLGVSGDVINGPDGNLQGNNLVIGKNFGERIAAKFIPPKDVDNINDRFKRLDVAIADYLQGALPADARPEEVSATARDGKWVITMQRNSQPAQPETVLQQAPVVDTKVEPPIEITKPDIQTNEVAVVPPTPEPEKKPEESSGSVPEQERPEGEATSDDKKESEAKEPEPAVGGAGEVPPQNPPPPPAEGPVEAEPPKPGKTYAEIAARLEELKGTEGSDDERKVLEEERGMLLEQARILGVDEKIRTAMAKELIGQRLPPTAFGSATMLEAKINQVKERVMEGVRQELTGGIIGKEALEVVDRLKGYETEVIASLVSNETARGQLEAEVGRIRAEKRNNVVIQKETTKEVKKPQELVAEAMARTGARPEDKPLWEEVVRDLTKGAAGYGAGEVVEEFLRRRHKAEREGEAGKAAGEKGGGPVKEERKAEAERGTGKVAEVDESLRGLEADDLQDELVNEPEGTQRFVALKKEKTERLKELKNFWEAHGVRNHFDDVGVDITQALMPVPPTEYMRILEKFQQDRRFGSYSHPDLPKHLEGLLRIAAVEEIENTRNKILRQALRSGNANIRGIVNEDMDTLEANRKEIDKNRIRHYTHVNTEPLLRMPPTMQDWENMNSGAGLEERSLAEAWYRLEGARIRKEEIDARVSGGKGEGLSVNPPPRDAVALFKQMYGRYEQVWPNVDFVDVRNPDDRRRWWLKNMGAYNNGSISTTNWKGLVDSWLGDLQYATTLSKAGYGMQVEIEKTEKDIKAAMAISSAAGAMIGSGGAADVYLQAETVSQKADLETQDKWRGYVLHDGPDKLFRVVSDPLVNKYYKKLLADAGVNVIIETGQPDARGNVNKVRKMEIDVNTARNSKLVSYLLSEPGKEYPGGFETYIRDVLLDKADVADLGEWSAAKLACDAFLVDKYSEWERDVTEEWGKRIKPSDSWGGDPLRATLEPSFLPNIIKGVYSGDAGADIFAIMDDAFRPDDIFFRLAEEARRQGKDPMLEALPATMAGEMKRYARWNEALSLFLGGSRAQGIPNWTKDTIGELDKIADLLDQVYRTPDGVTGKEVVGTMMARIIKCKVKATMLESGGPKLLDYVNTFFNSDPKAARPYFELETALFADDKGLMRKLSGERRGLVFSDKYGALRDIEEAKEILKAGSIEPKVRSRKNLLNIMGAVVDTLAIFAGGRKK